MKQFPTLGTICLAILTTVLTGAVNAQAQSQISLNSNSVVGGSGSWSTSAYNSGTYAAGNVFNSQSSSTISEPSQAGYWLGKDRDNQEYFVVDLGSSTSLSKIELFNTHNSFVNDRATLNYEIFASNTVVPVTVTETGQGGVDLSTAVSLGTGTFGFQGSANDPIEAEIFTPNTTTAYRYLRFNTYSSQAAAGVTPLGVGLSEMKVYAAVVPESGTLSLFVGTLPLIGAVAIVRRRTKKGETSFTQA